MQLTDAQIEKLILERDTLHAVCYDIVYGQARYNPAHPLNQIENVKAKLEAALKETHRMRYPDS